MNSKLRQQHSSIPSRVIGKFIGGALRGKFGRLLTYCASAQRLAPLVGRHFFLFRDPLISIASRAAEETHAFFGCVACGGVTRRPKDVASFRCDHCHRRSTTKIEDGNRRINEVECPHCDKELGLSNLLQASRNWHPLLIREQPIHSNGSLPRLRIAQKNDPTQDIRGTKHHGLHVRIPNGVETRALKRSGFSFWDELYTKTA